MSLDLAARPISRPYWATPKITGLAVLTLVFLCGALVGAVAMNLGHTKLHPRPFWADNSKVEYLKTIQKELDLTPEQTKQIESILEDFAMYYQTVLSDGKARIFSVLNEDQKRKFREMLKDRQP